MKGHLATSPLKTEDRRSAETNQQERERSAFEANSRAPAASGEPSLALAPEKVWTHTVALTGELHRRSAHLLEAEIERLCKEGVTGITLDLRGLTEIDSIGVAVIVFQCGLCKRRGYDFSLISGPPPIQRAFERASVAALLPFKDEEVTEASESPANA